MHQLIVPLALAGLKIHGHDTLAEQAIARTMAAIVISGRELHRQVGHAEIFIDADLSPDACIARILGRILFPCVVAELASAWGSCGRSRGACPS